MLETIKDLSKPNNTAVRDGFYRLKEEYSTNYYFVIGGKVYLCSNRIDVPENTEEVLEAISLKGEYLDKKVISYEVNYITVDTPKNKRGKVISNYAYYDFHNTFESNCFKGILVQIAYYKDDNGESRSSTDFCKIPY